MAKKTLPPEPPRTPPGPTLVLVAPSKTLRRGRKRAPDDTPRGKLTRDVPPEAGGPPKLPKSPLPAEVQARARAMFDARLEWLAAVVDGAHIETETIVYKRDGTEDESQYYRTRRRPSLDQRMDAMKMLGTFGRLTSPTVVGADGESADETDVALSQSIIGLLDARPASA